MPVKVGVVVVPSSSLLSSSAAASAFASALGRRRPRARSRHAPPAAGRSLLRGSFSFSTSSSPPPSSSSSPRTSPRRPPNVPVPECVLSPEAAAAAASSSSEFADAVRPYHSSQSPVVLRGPLSKSDPVYLWKSREYLRAAAGDETTCKVEIGGGGYADPNSERAEVPFGEYLRYLEMFEERYGSGGVKEEEEEETASATKSGKNGSDGDSGADVQQQIVYLAQNDLFPGLRNDLPVPEFCSDGSYGVGKGESYGINFWMGPRGCVSPLHYDPLDNLFMQFVGRKRVLLFPRTEVSKGHGGGGGADRHEQEVGWYYAGGGTASSQDSAIGLGTAGGGQYNTSAVDPERPDLDRHPLFADAPAAMECVVRPGDVLYVPSKWWHHVRSLETSVSANVWWR